MPKRAVRAQTALARERALVAETRRVAVRKRAESAAADAGVDLSPVAPARDRRFGPAAVPDQASTPPPAHSGRRLPGQRVECCWCGEPILVAARGPLPKWCSPSCRQRAWEQQRAARAGLAAVQVRDRYVRAVPADGPGWMEQLGVLASQVAAGPRPIADRDLPDLAAALEVVLAAVAGRAGRGRRDRSGR